MATPHTVFIDGQEGTTGLQIRDRLIARSDIRLLEIDPERRKDVAERQRLLNAADAVVLCLPDEAARESVALIENPQTRVVDASTAHRTDAAWTYGLPELHRGQRAAIAAARRISNPGCHATGFILALRPLVACGLVPADLPISATSLTGYSGGGKKLIATHEAHRGEEAFAARPYALGLRHKHLPEMQTHTGLRTAPHFVPVVVDLYCGMVVTIPLHVRQLPGAPSPATVHAALREAYAGEPFVQVQPLGEAALEGGFLAPHSCNRSNRLDLFVFGHEEQILLAARFDNLGKGASGAAVQNLNLCLGLPETAGL